MRWSEKREYLPAWVYFLCAGIFIAFVLGEWALHPAVPPGTPCGETGCGGGTVCVLITRSPLRGVCEQRCTTDGDCPPGQPCKLNLDEASQSNAAKVCVRPRK